MSVIAKGLLVNSFSKTLIGEVKFLNYAKSLIQQFFFFLVFIYNIFKLYISIFHWGCLGKHDQYNICKIYEDKKLITMKIALTGKLYIYLLANKYVETSA